MGSRLAWIAAGIVAGLVGPWAIPLAHAATSATDVAIGMPGAVTTDAQGNVYFSSQTMVFKLDRLGQLSVVAGSRVAGYAGDGGPATAALLNFPYTYPELMRDTIDWSELVGGLAVDSAGNLFIADAYNNRVRKIDQAGIISTVAGAGARGHSGDGGAATSANFWFPQGVAVDPASNLLISDSNGTLRKVTTDGIVHAVAGNNCGAHPQPGLCGPVGIATDSAGNVYVADGYCDIRKVSPSGTVTEVAGDPRPGAGSANWTCGYSGDGGPATLAALSYPYAVAVDVQGNLYIADNGNSCIRKVDVPGTITTVAGICKFDGSSRGYSGDGGPAVSAQLDSPHGVAVDLAGNLYIADTGNFRIRVVSTDGRIRTVAGSGIGGPAGSLIAIDSVNRMGPPVTSVSAGLPVTLGFLVGGSKPTGTVIFQEGSVTFGSVAVTVYSSSYIFLSQANISIPDLAVGSHNITATYSGDSNNAPSSTVFALTATANTGNSGSTGNTASPGGSGSSGGGGDMNPLGLAALLLLAVARLKRTGRSSLPSHAFISTDRQTSRAGRATIAPTPIPRETRPEPPQHRTAGGRGNLLTHRH
jgi:sugar lactone lactonase YvrE